MIDRMTKYSFILLMQDKDSFIENLRDIGVIDITRGSKPVDEHSETLLSNIQEKKTLIKEISSGMDAHLSELNTVLKEHEKELREAQAWGDYDKEKLKGLGIDIHYFCLRDKDFDESWKEQFAIQPVWKENGKIWFVVVGDAEGFPYKEIPAPQHTASEIRSSIEIIKAEIDSYTKALEARKSELPIMETELHRMEMDLSAYLASLQGSEAAERELVTYVGFAPIGKDAELKTTFDGMEGIFYWSEPADVEDNPPIEFRNNRFVQMFEPLTDMYGRPAYNGFDPTPYISIFFLLFFAMCMGDAGYGIILIITGFLLKKAKSFANLAPLVITLGIGTVIIGFFFHTFFSMDISQWQCIPDSVKKIFVPAKVAGYDGTMILALAIGVIHLCLAMTVKAIYAVKNNGFANSLGVLGWTLLIVGGVIVGAFALAGVISAKATKIIIITIGIISAHGIFLLNDLHRNPALNIGSGLWETYNTATGVLGDVLSYLRLYALGLAGGMLGFAFNDLAEMARGDGGISGWIFFILIVVVGHTLNLAMAALGAFVHPLRLNFLEFFKNSGYEGTGHKYNPIKK